MFGYGRDLPPEKRKWEENYSFWKLRKDATINTRTITNFLCPDFEICRLIRSQCAYEKWVVKSVGEPTATIAQMTYIAQMNNHRI